MLNEETPRLCAAADAQALGHGVRKRCVDTDVTLLSDLDALLEPVTAGARDDRPLRWTSKTIRKLSAEVQTLGHWVRPRLLHELG